MHNLVTKTLGLIAVAALCVPGPAHAEDDRTLAEICIQDFAKAPRACMEDIQKSFDASLECLGVIASAYATIETHAIAGECTIPQATFCVTQGGSGSDCGGG